MKYLLLLILGAGACLAQEPCVSGEHPNNAPDCIPAEKMIWPIVASVKITAIGKLKCAGNQHIEGDGKSETANHCVDDKPAPLKCEKYEHVEYESCPRDQMVMKNWETGEFTCLRPEKSYCAPDLHTVTEREWQELLERLKKLEEKPQPQKHITACARRPDSAVFWADGRATLYADGIVADRERMWFDSLPTCTEKDFAIWKKSALNSAVAP